MRRYLSFIPVTIAFSVSLIAIYLILAPGISGPFLLDDHVHFPKLYGNDGNIDTVDEVLDLVASGSSATGRPLSFLSLLIENNGWPVKPQSYKHNNVLFHLLNFCLVFLLTVKLLAFTKFKSKNSSVYVALSISVIWAVAPIQESAVFLTIQRMTLLSTSMMLISIILMLTAWERERSNRFSFFAYFLAGLFCVAGLLFKEVAVLTVFYVYAAAYLAKRSGAKVYLYGLIKFSCVAVIFACIAYFFFDYAKMQSLYEKRSFTMAERLMTEGRVLINYIRQILLPSMSGLGPFHDGYTVSRSLIEPITTLFSWVAIFFWIVVSISLRSKAPLFVFATLWFFFGHFLESSFLPLEIYFEHRNYLPAYGIIFFVSLSVLAALPSKFAILTFSVYLILISFVSHAGAKVWGSQVDLYHIWLEENPSSTRARIEVVKNELSKGRPDIADSIYKDGLEYHDQHAGYHLFGYVIGKCLTPNYKFYEIKKAGLYKIIERSGFDHASLEGITWLVKSWEKWNCNLELDDIRDIAEKYLLSERFYKVKDARLNLENNLSKIAIKQKDLNSAVSYLEKNFEVSGDPTFLLNAAYLLASAGLYEEARGFFGIVDSRISEESNPIDKIRYQRTRDNIYDVTQRMQAEKNIIREQHED